ncbi:alpha-tocopherol transfer protein-like [Epargyreus clarus]|uniref:alpha-tocopherol transfer protein-like n=1 Tax=Epargyreus clarus TaxID=520877 RepID=UPI003C2B1637
MEFIPQNPILEFKEDTLSNLRKQYNFEKPDDMDRAIDVLDAWVKKQNHFLRKAFPRSYLEKTIIANKGSIEGAKIKLDKICTFRTLMPDFFGENLTKNNFENLEDFCSISALLPKPTDDNYRVYFLKNKGQTFVSQQLLNLYRYVVLICEYKLAYDYSNGMVVFIDFTEANLIDLVTAIDLTEMRQAIAIVTEGFGMRLNGIHLLTSSKAIEALVTIFKQLLPAKVGSRICVHKDMGTVYQYIPKDVFPSEYGGKEKSLLKLSDDLTDALTAKDFREYIEGMNEAKTNEACRQTDKFNDQYLGTPGSFRTLTTD